MALETNADKLRRSTFITPELWAKCKAMATMKGQKIGQWIAGAMQEKLNKELTEAQNEK
jgi:hypothetical protein